MARGTRSQFGCRAFNVKRDTGGADMARLLSASSRGREARNLTRAGAREPVLAVETKLGDDEVGRGLRLLRARFHDCRAWQVHATGAKDYRTREGIRVAPAIELLQTLV
jgi:hypothetical protein